MVAGVSGVYSITDAMVELQAEADLRAQSERLRAQLEATLRARVESEVSGRTRRSG